MSLNTKAAKECLEIINNSFDGNKNKAANMLEQLAKIKSNQSFHNSMQLLVDLAQHGLNKEMKS